MHSRVIILTPSPTRINKVEAAQEVAEAAQRVPGESQRTLVRLKYFISFPTVKRNYHFPFAALGQALACLPGSLAWAEGSQVRELKVGNEK